MKRLILFKTAADQQTADILVEVESFDSGGPVSISPTDPITTATATLQVAFDKVRQVAELAAARLKGMSIRPDEVSLELGVKFDAKAGVIFSSVGAEANVKISMSWGKP
jgi:hypothetical protein